MVPLMIDATAMICLLYIKSGANMGYIGIACYRWGILLAGGVLNAIGNG